MAVKLVRKRRKNADGTYDTVHYETQAKGVWFEDGESIQEKFDSGNLGGGGGEEAVAAHNASSTAHSDIRVLVSAAQSTADSKATMSEVNAAIEAAFAGIARAEGVRF